MVSFSSDFPASILLVRFLSCTCRLQSKISFSSFWRSVTRYSVFSGLSDPVLDATVDQLDLLGDSKLRDDPHRTRLKSLLVASALPLRQRKTRCFPLDGPDLSLTSKTLVHKQLCLFCAQAEAEVFRLLSLQQSRHFARRKVSGEYTTQISQNAPRTDHYHC